MPPDAAKHQESNTHRGFPLSHVNRSGLSATGRGEVPTSDHPHSTQGFDHIALSFSRLLNQSPTLKRFAMVPPITA